MIKISVLYPASDGAKFDIDYYCKTHMPLVQEKVGPALKSVAVEQGVAGGAPGAPAPFAALGHLYFDSISDFQTYFTPHAEVLMADLRNFTNIQPTVQISEVKM